MPARAQTVTDYLSEQEAFINQAVQVQIQGEKQEKRHENSANFMGNEPMPFYIPPGDK
jgi:hypothetical protein